MTWAHSLNDLATGLRLLRALPGYLRHPLTLEEARRILDERRRRRADDLLALVRRTIYERPRSPYHALLRHAGCELGDFERLVGADGVEGALRLLVRRGVYLTGDEFKGRTPVARGSLRFEIDPARLRNPFAVAALGASTSGSRGRAARVPISLDSIRDRAVNTYLTLEARGGDAWRNAVWGAPGMGPLLWYSACGGPAARWFSTVDPWRPEVHSRYRQSLRMLRWASRLAGVPLPALEPVSIADTMPIALWMAAELRRGATPHLWCSSSAAVRLCRRSAEESLDLAGAQFTLTGEPVTAARLAAVRATGAEASPDYGAADSGGPLTAGCLAPAAADDVHFFDDLHALVTAEEPAPFPAGAMLFTSLRPTAPLVLLNVSLGDRAVVETRACGCALEGLGWRRHIHTIRSFEKLTAGGMNLLDSDVVDILDEVLPRRFGGGPTDYQLVEDETSDGEPRLRLRVAPAVGPLDPEAVAAAFLAAIAAHSPTSHLMALQAQDAGLLRVERTEPSAGAGNGRGGSTKILHVRSVAVPGATLSTPPE